LMVHKWSHQEPKEFLLKTEKPSRYLISTSFFDG
jgi:hypothetical protein